MNRQRSRRALTAAVLALALIPILGTTPHRLERVTDIGRLETAARAALFHARFDPGAIQTALDVVGGQTLRVDLDRLRRWQPDRFVPGPVNAALGHLRLANMGALAFRTDDGLLTLSLRSRSVFANSEESSIVLAQRTHEGGWRLTGEALAWAPAAVRAAVCIEQDAPVSGMPTWELRLRRLLRSVDRVELSFDEEWALVATLEPRIAAASAAGFVASMLGDGFVLADDEESWTYGEFQLSLETEARPVTVTLRWQLGAHRDAPDQPIEAQPG
ncbi:MAG: hypothetical protein ACTS22_04875 [Phycisphaerales bacterium]